MTNEGSEYLLYFPEWTALYRLVSAKYTELCLRIEQTHQRIVEELTKCSNLQSYCSTVEQHIFKEHLLALHAGTEKKQIWCTLLSWM